MYSSPGSNSLWLAALAAGLCCAAAIAQGPQSAEAPPEQLVLETNPAVQAALELPRTEPSHYVTAILSLVDLGRAELAAPILKELQSLNLSDAQRADLAREFGTHRMMQLAGTKELAPAGREFADACLAAAAAEARDPKRIEQLIEQLTDDSPEARLAARVDLESAGMPGVVAVVEAFGREPDPARRMAFAAAIVRMDPLVVGPLLGMLATDNPELMGDVARLLEALQVSPAVPFIAAAKATDPVTEAQAERLLVDAIGRYQQGSPAFVADANNQVRLWYWDGDKLTSHMYPVEEAQEIWTARLAVALSQLRPENSAYRRQAILLGLEAGGSPRDATGNPLAAVSVFADLRSVPSLIQQADADELSLILAEAMKQDYARAAAAVAYDLLERDDVNVLYVAAPQLSPLVAALDHPNRNVRFAALRTIVTLKPQAPFAGSSFVPKALRYFASSTGERQALVAMPTIARAADIAGLLRQADVDAEITNRGSTAVLLAQEMSDLEFVLVDMDIQRPGIRDVLYGLRIEAATGQVPIGLLAGAGRFEAAQKLADEHQRVIAFSRPHSEEAVTAIADRLLALAGRDYVPPEERLSQAAQAQAWIERLLAEGPAFYDVHRQADVIRALSADEEEVTNTR